MAQDFNTSLISVASNFLKVLGVPFTRPILKKRLEENPYYPSLYALSEALKWYKVEHKGIEISDELLDELPRPFLAYLKIKSIGGRDFVNVINVSSNSVTYYYNKEVTVSKEEFTSSWQSKVVLLAEKNENSGEKNIEKNKKDAVVRRNKIVMLLLGFAIIFAPIAINYSQSSVNFLYTISLMLFTLSGLAISVLLLIYEIDKSNAFVKNICSGGAKTNCDAVLGSKAANVFGVSWGEVGFFYFSSMVLFLLIPGIGFQDKVPYISLISVLSALYIPFSLFYQYKVAKQWCRLCLMVQAVLFLNLFWTLSFGNFDVHFDLRNIILFIGCILFPILIWYTFKPIILKAMDAEKFQSAFKRLYSRQDIFELTLAEQDEAPEGWQTLRWLEKGNTNASTVILKVCNPYCGHCNTAHRIFNEILKENDNVKIVTIYGINDNEIDNERRLPVQHFLALQEQAESLPEGKNYQKLYQAMDYWYLTPNRNYESLQQQYPVDVVLFEKQKTKVAAMKDWYKAALIEYTPTVYVNGKKLPSMFNLEDLKDVFI